VCHILNTSILIVLNWDGFVLFESLPLFVCYFVSSCDILHVYLLYS